MTAHGLVDPPPASEPRQCAKSVDFGELDPAHAQFMIDAVSKMPVTDERTEVLSWLVYRYLICTRPELAAS
jgi:hypothetical protein